jgi:GNAT superfamily N-acetyltransferase
MHCQLAETDTEILACYPVMAALRPHILEQEFVARVRRQQRDGYRLVFLEEAGEVRAVAGFRLAESLAWGKYLYVDDLVSRMTVRSRGYGQALFQWLIAWARDHGCEALHLDSGVQNGAAHRFYMQNRMVITSHHFKLPLVEGSAVPARDTHGGRVPEGHGVGRSQRLG